jgi:plasmid stability protein
MGSLLIRNLDDRLKARLRVRAAEHGRSMEEEARAILRRDLEDHEEVSLGSLAKSLFGEKNGVDLEPHPPVWAREPPDFGE